jgi:hypothetical protein
MFSFPPESYRRIVGASLANDANFIRGIATPSVGQLLLALRLGAFA